ncbi:Putative peptidoglycan binding domain-containing protein [Thermosyntropha lipolytica DSM 11003]|uniref:Putative peptidoglycan binding domain-containing protein n=1 Tax=Thermosyntropha lipolytica DSM 11003 TaxID=1123382 RepID=A0A1M5NBJ1_9FIRM|nr:LysM peptidoglycan-binding domain-containing protein [Thermosyntropha lipolytica]SHG86363.1 Putative peptidoglycan binding domain-containing protein [Thermosyntropha lipolytica DSM 11003]
MPKKLSRKLLAPVLLILFTFSGVINLSAADNPYGLDNLRLGSRGTYVQNLQRDLTFLGYDTKGVDGIFGSNTYSAVVRFQRDHNLYPDGIVGRQTKEVLSRKIAARTYTVRAGDTLYKISLKYGTSVNAVKQANNLKSDMIYPGQVLLIPSSGTTTPSRGGIRYPEAADWWTDVQYVFTRGSIATVTDVDTGISYQVRRKGGTNHADCEPLTKADTAKMKQIYGGQWSWARRAVIVSVNGRVFAASQNGMPHGLYDIYDNNFDGHFCIHFKNSRTHGTNRVDEAHQAAVMKAAGYRI